MKPSHAAKPSHAQRWIERQYGSVRAGLLTELQVMSPHDLAKKWEVHYNTIRSWIAAEKLERYVGYRVRDEEPAGVEA
jgi:hypothetical protein